MQVPLPLCVSTNTLSQMSATVKCRPMQRKTYKQFLQEVTEDISIWFSFISENNEAVISGNN